MNTALHTPLPWAASPASFVNDTGGVDYAIQDSERAILAEVFEHVGSNGYGGYVTRPAKANAEFICKAVNEYASLRSRADAVEALEKALEEVCMRARRIRENNAVVGIEASYIERIAQSALALVAKDRGIT